MRRATVDVAGMAFVADHAGALFEETAGLLIVADLHLEKGSAYAARRVLLPPYDTAATLAKLCHLVLRYRPRAIAALGDSFHDRRAGERIQRADRETIAQLQRGRDWLWIAGNHDPESPKGLGGEAHREIRFGSLTLRHEPRLGVAFGEIAGHLHPVARVASSRGHLRRRCFVGDGSRCVMPAFGAYAGGLNLRDAAFAPLFLGPAFTAHVLGRDRVYAVAPGRCIAD
ncbi:MAG TPA: ligase-associated DNA damage response endonuclease PdeM [Beijerinckiaceae bacterium]|nr:ligase-associated DNA damage response endonuclease PdeM [Beijerinckiaceae bacterium]